MNKTTNACVLDLHVSTFTFCFVAKNGTLGPLVLNQLEASAIKNLKVT